MADDYWQRNPKAVRGSKFGPSEQDEEDFEQEQAIREWLEQSGNSHEFRFEHINRQGNARNTLIKAHVRLDQKIGEDGSATFADLIAGYDGRDLESRDEPRDIERESQDKIYGYLHALGFKRGDILWLISMLKLSIQENKSRFEKLVTDSEW